MEEIQRDGFCHYERQSVKEKERQKRRRGRRGRKRGQKRRRTAVPRHECVLPIGMIKNLGKKIKKKC